MTDERDGRRAWRLWGGAVVATALYASYSIGFARGQAQSAVLVSPYLPCTHDLTPFIQPMTVIETPQELVNIFDHLAEQGINARDNPAVPNTPTPH